MEIINMKITDIHPYEKNPRHNDEAVDAVAKSLKEFGWQQPVVVDKDHVIIVGHPRVKAAERLGLTEVPCIIADNLSPEQVQAYRIADNKTGEIAEWDYNLLPVEIKDLQDANFDLSILGFDEDEFDKLLNGRKLAVNLYGGNCRIGGGSPWTKDGTKADLTLNLLARRKALQYIKNLPSIGEVHCAISCKIGSSDVLVTLYDGHMNELISYRETVYPSDLIREFHLNEPRFAKMCLDGLFT